MRENVLIRRLLDSKRDGIINTEYNFVQKDTESKCYKFPVCFNLLHNGELIDLQIA